MLAFQSGLPGSPTIGPNFGSKWPFFVFLGQFPMKSSGLLIGLLSMLTSLINLVLSALDISSNLTFTIGAMEEEFKMEMRMVMLESLDPENSQGRAVCAIAMLLKLAAVVALVLR